MLFLTDSEDSNSLDSSFVAEIEHELIENHKNNVLTDQDALSTSSDDEVLEPISQSSPKFSKTFQESLIKKELFKEDEDDDDDEDFLLYDQLAMASASNLSKEKATNSSHHSKLSDSVKKDNWFIENVIDVFGEKFVSKHNPELVVNAFTYCYSFVQFYLQPHKVFKTGTKICDKNAKPRLDSCISYLKRIDLKTTYSIILPVNRNLNGGEHWYLASIFFPLKYVVLFDSDFASKRDEEYRELFLMLFHFIELIAFVEDKKVFFSDWKFMVASSSELPQQDNTTDCGAFVCMYMHSLMFNDLSFGKYFSQEQRRDFVRNVLDNYPEPTDQIGRFTVPSKPSISEKLKIKNISYSVSTASVVLEVFHEFFLKDVCKVCEQGFKNKRLYYRCIFCNYTTHLLCIPKLLFKCNCT